MLQSSVLHPYCSGLQTHRPYPGLLQGSHPHSLRAERSAQDCGPVPGYSGHLIPEEPGRERGGWGRERERKKEKAVTCRMGHEYGMARVECEWDQ